MNEMKQVLPPPSLMKTGHLGCGTV